ncbi:DUF6777 domain-containing protein [Streptomyces albicerus]|uniref:DUF6777 domain-containing protein n=1 Tax=Streptomyces albicerus TaxID=2569859 RepID=UPI00124B5CF0|nr:DUF6777 domain-containing protein [Streptomyces albicerus]
MHIPTRTLVTACALSAALLVAGCGGDEDTASRTSGTVDGEVFLQPVAAQGPDPFTGSTATTTATPPPVTRTPQSPPTTGSAPATAEGARSVSGATPGLYGGTQRVGSCDVQRQIRFLTADQAKARAFAQAAGVSQPGIPDYLRGLTSVVLRADTRVTNHGFRDGRPTSYQSVLQAGTAVLVDNRGVPRVRCACGNPLKPPVAFEGTPGHNGSPWPGYRPAKVIVVTPAPQMIVNITIINIQNNTWIERRIGDHDGDEDRVVPPPVDDPESRSPGMSSLSPDESSPDGSSETPDESLSPDESPTDCVTPTVTVTPGEPDEPPTEEPMDPSTPEDCPTATVTATPETPGDEPLPPPDENTAPETETLPDTTVPDESDVVEPEPPLDSSEDSPESEVGPDSVPDSADVPDGGGLIPDESSVDSALDTLDS